MALNKGASLDVGADGEGQLKISILIILSRRGPLMRTIKLIIVLKLKC